MIPAGVPTAEVLAVEQTKLYNSIARVLSDFATHENKTASQRMTIAKHNWPHCIKPCEGCEKTLIVCLEIAAGACRFVAQKK